MEVGFDPGDTVRWKPRSPKKRGTAAPTSRPHVYCGQTAGWIKVPFGTQVGLGPRHIVIDGDAAPTERGTAGPHLSAHVCGLMVAHLSNC